MPLLRDTRESVIPMVAIAVLVLVAVGGGSVYLLTRSGGINSETIQKSIEQVKTNTMQDNTPMDGKKCMSGNDCASGYYCSLKAPALQLDKDGKPMPASISDIKEPGECMKLKPTAKPVVSKKTEPK